MNLPENLRAWDVTEKMQDYQLKVALNYLNGVTSAPGEANTSPPGGTDWTSSAVTMSFIAGGAG